jgi:hypothetical protein
MATSLKKCNVHPALWYEEWECPWCAEVRDLTYRLGEAEAWAEKLQATIERWEAGERDVDKADNG